MKPRHAAALALVGWYLMMPPNTQGWFSKTKNNDEAAPLDQWTIVRSFDTALMCEHYRGNDDETWQDAANSLLNKVRKLRLNPTIW
jgi:hypothetical protein